MIDLSYGYRSLPPDFDPHPARAGLDLLHLDGDALDLRVFEHEICDPLGQRFDQRNMTFSHNQTNAVCNNVIREHVTQILRWLRRASNIGVYVEAHALRN